MAACIAALRRTEHPILSPERLDCFDSPRFRTFYPGPAQKLNSTGLGRYDIEEARMFLVILGRGTESSRHGRGRGLHGPERALRHIETDDERSVQGGWRAVLLGRF